MITEGKNTTEENSPRGVFSLFFKKIIFLWIFDKKRRVSDILLKNNTLQ